MVIVGLLSVAAGGRAGAAPEAVRAVVASDQVAALAEATVVAKFDAYSIVEVPDTQEGRAAVTMAGGAIREDLHRVHLNRETIDTRTPSARAALQRVGAGATGRRLQLVQFPTPVGDDQLAALDAAGFAIVHAVPENAFIVWRRSSIQSTRLAEMASDAKTPGKAPAWVGEYRPDHALSPALDRAMAERPDDAVAVMVQLFNYEIEGAALSAMQVAETLAATSVGRVKPPAASLGGKYINVGIEVPARNLAAIAALDAVVYVEPWARRERLDESQGQSLAGNLNMAGTYPSGPGYLAWLADRGFPTTPASYPIVCIVDDGVDDGDATPQDRTLREAGDPAGNSRLVFNINKTTEPTPAGPDGHGHINASIAASNDPRAGAPTISPEGFNRGIGIAPYARLGNLKVFFDNLGPWWGGDDEELALDQSMNAVGVSSNSWGDNVQGAYNNSAQTFDALARDADPILPGHQQLFFVFAAGNAGPVVNTINSPATSKNSLAVGATEGFVGQGIADGCGISSANNVNDMASLSSRGPCDDNRVKPDVVAPGLHITGTTPPGFNGVGVCGASGGQAYFPSGQTIYTWSSGTSHSTPALAGFAALVGNFLEREYGFSALPSGANAPSPALMKAYIVHATRYLNGGTGTGGNLPSNNQGYGLPNGAFAFSTTAPRFFRNQQDTLGAPGESSTFLGYVPNPAEPVRVVLAWTDAPGPLSGNAYVNNLDLLVGNAPVTYKGNVFTSDISVTGGAHDARNNVEAVFLPAGALSGSSRINVNAFALNGDGVPGNADTTDQDFALVAYNFVQAQQQGRVFFRRPTSGSTGTTTVDLFDSDLAAIDLAYVALTTSNGDSELLEVFANPSGSGVFTGQIATTTGAPTPANGILQTACDGTVTALYLDADPGPGNPYSTTDTLSAVCAGPTISTVQITDLTSTSARITFATNMTAAGRVSLGTGACGVATTTVDGPVTTTHSLPLAGLIPNTLYRFSLSAESDESGLVAINDNAGACFSFATPPAGRHFTELFTPGENDLDNITLTFTPNGSPDFYTVCRAAAVSFPTSPAGGTVVMPGDEGSVLVNIAGGQFVPFYGVNYSALHINGNGYLTFAPIAVVDATESVTEHFSRVQIAGLYDDLNSDPNTLPPTLPGGGTISHRQLVDRFVVTFQNVPEYNTDAATNRNSFQIEMFFDGRIRMTWLGIAAGDGLAGLSRGGGLPADFAETNLDSGTVCGGWIPGDVNGDGRVDLADVTTLNNYLSGVATILPPGDPDVDNSGVINAADTTMLVNHLVNQVPPALP